MWRLVAAISFGALVACSQEASVSVSDAQIGGPEACSNEPNAKASGGDEQYEAALRERRDMLLGSHCLRRGKGVVLRYVRKTPEIPFVSDTQEFTQLTIEVPSLPSKGERLTLGAQEARVVLSISGVWHYIGIGSVAKSGEGTITLIGQHAGEVKVTANITAPMIRTDDGHKTTHSLQLEREFVPASLESLVSCLGRTPWCPDS